MAGIMTSVQGRHFIRREDAKTQAQNKVELPNLQPCTMWKAVTGLD